MIPGPLAPWHGVPLAPWHLKQCTALLLVLVLSGCRDTGVTTEAYATLAEAEQAGAISKGLIPAMLPTSAHDIREAHDLERHRRWGLFDFHPSDAAALRSTLRQEELSLSGVSCDMPARIEWWPVILRGELNPDMVKTAELTAHLAQQGGLIVLVNWKQGRAYYWTR